MFVRSGIESFFLMSRIQFHSLFLLACFLVGCGSYPTHVDGSSLPSSLDFEQHYFIKDNVDNVLNKLKCMRWRGGEIEFSEHVSVTSSQLARLCDMIDSGVVRITRVSINNASLLDACSIKRLLNTEGITGVSLLNLRNIPLELSKTKIKTLKVGGKLNFNSILEQLKGTAVRNLIFDLYDNEKCIKNLNLNVLNELDVELEILTSEAEKNTTKAYNKGVVTICPGYRQ